MSLNEQTLCKLIDLIVECKGQDPAVATVLLTVVSCCAVGRTEAMADFLEEFCRGEIARLKEEMT